MPALFRLPAFHSLSGPFPDLNTFAIQIERETACVGLHKRSVAGVLELLQERLSLIPAYLTVISTEGRDLPQAGKWPTRVLAALLQRDDNSLPKQSVAGIYSIANNKVASSLIHHDLVVNKKSPAKTAGQKDGTSLGLLIPNGPLREASGPAPGYSAFENKMQASRLTHSLILIKDQPFDISELNR